MMMTVIHRHELKVLQCCVAFNARHLKCYRAHHARSNSKFFCQVVAYASPSPFLEKINWTYDAFRKLQEQAKALLRQQVSRHEHYFNLFMYFSTTSIMLYFCSLGLLSITTDQTAHIHRDVFSLDISATVSAQVQWNVFCHGISSIEQNSDTINPTFSHGLPPSDLLSLLSCNPKSNSSLMSECRQFLLLVVVDSSCHKSEHKGADFLLSCGPSGFCEYGTQDR